MNEPWPPGTDTTGKLKAFIEAQLAVPKFKSRLPRQHLRVIKEGARETSGITVRIVAQAATKRPRVYPVGNSTKATARWFKLGLFVKADQKAGGAQSVEAVHSILEEVFLPYRDSPEMNSLIETGFYMCQPSTEGFIADPGDNTDEATFASKELQLQFCTAAYVA